MSVEEKQDNLLCISSRDSSCNEIKTEAMTILKMKELFQDIRRKAILGYVKCILQIK